MKRSIALATTLALGCAAAAEPARCTRPSSKDPFSVTFHLSYGDRDSWSGELTHGTLYWNAYTSFGSGSAMGQFRVSAERDKAIREAMEESNFFNLPEDIGPEPRVLHASMAIVEVRSGQNKCRVALYDPDEMRGDARAARFRAVWKEIWEAVPVRPAWNIQGLTTQGSGP
jgi:hypothetical protein